MSTWPPHSHRTGAAPPTITEPAASQQPHDFTFR